MLNTKEDARLRIKRQAGTGKRIFIGSSTQALEKAWCVQATLKELGAEADIWDQVFTPGQITIHELIRKTQEYDGAVLLLAPDDRIERTKSPQDCGAPKDGSYVETTFSYIPRDNVLVEAGMFMGVLGTEAVALCEVPGIWRTSDFGGITRVEYNVRNREEMKESFWKWLSKGVIAGKRSGTSLKSKRTG